MQRVGAVAGIARGRGVTPPNSIRICGACHPSLQPLSSSSRPGLGLGELVTMWLGRPVGSPIVIAPAMPVPVRSCWAVRGPSASGPHMGHISHTAGYVCALALCGLVAVGRLCLSSGSLGAADLGP